MLFHPLDRDIFPARLPSMSDVHFSCNFTIAGSSLSSGTLVDLILNRSTYEGESVNDIKRKQM
jgi:hypothetical protein